MVEVSGKTFLSKGKDKEKILKAGEKTTCYIYKGTTIKLSENFSAETFQPKWDWHDRFEVLEEKNC